MLASGARGATVGDLIDWIEKTRADCGLDSLPSPVEIHITVEFYSTLTAADADAIRAEVAGKPDHPKRADLQQYERQVKAGPSVQRRVYTLRDEEHWRYNTDFSGDFPFFDEAFTPEQAWSLSTEDMVVMDPRHGAPPGRDISASAQTASHNIRAFTCGGAHWWFDLVCDKPRDAALDSSFRLVFNRGGKPGLTVSGEWIEADRRAQIKEIEPFGPDGRRSSRTLNEGWHRHPVLDRWVPARVSEYSAEGRLTNVMTLGTVALVANDRFEELLRLPALDGSDAVRGPVTAKRMRDYRPDSSALTRRGADGTLSQSPLPSPAAHDYWTMRVIGWVTASLLIGGLIVFRWMRRT